MRTRNINGRTETDLQRMLRTPTNRIGTFPAPARRGMYLPMPDSFIITMALAIVATMAVVVALSSFVQ